MSTDEMDIDEESEQEDPFLEAELDRALEPYRDLMSPEMLEHYRELLGDLLTTHPEGKRLLERARPRRAPDKSGQRVKEGFEEPDSRGKGGRVA
ncbi:MAG: hypothetical protein IT372_28060 [Polyangiaceae bacterium]|nr:hypothetical protein [Polyangiaceae bacterium]